MPRKTKNELTILRREIHLQRDEEWIKKTYFDTFRNVKVKELLEKDLKDN